MSPARLLPSPGRAPPLTCSHVGCGEVIGSLLIASQAYLLPPPGRAPPLVWGICVGEAERSQVSVIGGEKTVLSKLRIAQWHVCNKNSRIRCLCLCGDQERPPSRLVVVLHEASAGKLLFIYTLVKASSACSLKNPQMDLQAMDRCHRIGQTCPVYVYRLAISHSVEGRIINIAFGKLKLEHFSNCKGQFGQTAWSLMRWMRPSC